MKFNDTTNNTGICQDVWFLTNTNSTSLPVADIARITNKVLRELAILAWRFSSKWKFDDRNHSTHNIATISLVNSQGDYELASTDFDIDRAEIVKSDGTSYRLQFISSEDISGSIPEFMKQDGEPKYYFLRGNSIWLKPEPDTSKVQTLRIYLSRDISEFTASDTNKEPGIPSVLHPIVPIMVALEYSGANGLPQTTFLNKKYEEWRQYFVEYFSERGSEKRASIKPAYINFE